MLKGLTNSIKKSCGDIEVSLSEYIVMNGKTIPIKAELSDDCYDNGNFIGTFILKELRFETSNELSYRNKEFVYYKKINGESIKIGTFITTEISNNDSEETTQVVAMDYGLKSQIEYKSELDYASGNITLLDVWNECCELSGLESGITSFTNSDFIVTDDQFTGTGATIRDVFIGIALSSGSFVKVMDDDRIYLLFNEYSKDKKSGSNINIQDGIYNTPITTQIDGKSVQNTTTGNQLIDFSNPVAKTDNTMTLTFENDVLTTTCTANGSYRSFSWSITDLIKANAGKTLYFTFEKYDRTNATSAGVNLQINDGTTVSYHTLVDSNNKPIPYVIPTDVSNINAVSFRVLPNNSSTAKASTFVITKPMLSIGSDKPEYEPYTGGQSSPNPDYPQEIESVSGVNSLLKNTNVNSGDGNYWSAYSTFDKTTRTLTRSTTATTESFIEHRISGLKSNATYTLFVEAKSNGYVRDMDLYCFNVNTQGVKSKTKLSLSTEFKKYSFTFTTDNNVDYSSSRIRIDNNGSTTSGTEAILTVKDVTLVEGTYNDYVPYGHWLAVTNTGKNLFDKDNTTKGFLRLRDGVQDNNDSWTQSGYVSVKPNTSYTLSNSIELEGNGYFELTKYTKNATWISSIQCGTKNNKSYTFTTDSNVYYVRIAAYLLGDKTDNIQLEQNSEPTDYEPYQSTSSLVDMNKPNLFDYEDESNYVESTNSSIEKINNGIRVTNKIAGIYKFARYKIENNIVKTMLGKTYTFSCDFAASGSNNGLVAIYWSNSNNSAFSNILNLNISGNYITFTLPSEIPTGAEYISLLFYSNKNSDTVKVGDYVDYTNIKLYEGDKDYYELSSIGNIKDELNIDKDGNVSIKQSIGEVVLDGSETWNKNNSLSSGFVNPSHVTAFDGHLIGSTLGMSNKFVFQNNTQTWTGTGKCRFNEGGAFWIMLTDTNITTVADFKTWLSTHPVTVKYVLAEPKTVELNKTKPLKILNGTNNITSNDDLQPNMRVEYSIIEEIIEEYTELQDKRDTQPITCVRLGMSQIEGENVDIQDEELIKKYGEHWLIINDNPFAYTQAKRVQLINAIFEKVKGFGYSAFVSKTSFKPYLTCGDVIKFRNKAGELIKSIILRYSHDFEEITLEAPSETSATVNYVYPTKDIDLIKRTEIIVDKNTNQITSLTQQTETIQDNLQQNYYDRTQTNELIQTSSTGITNTFSEAGGNNVFRNTGLWFSDQEENTWEYWTGIAKKTTNDKAVLGTSILLQSGTFSQEQEVPNGNYAISFYYKLLNSLAKATVTINENTYELTSTDYKQFYTGEQDENKQYITFPIEVTATHLNISFTTDIDNSVEVYDLMANKGSVKLAYSQNENEITTDTVNISKGITITSSVNDTKFKANADGIRIVDKNNDDNKITEFTDKGMTTKEAVVEDEATIVQVLIQNIGDQTWFTRL